MSKKEISVEEVKRIRSDLEKIVEAHRDTSPLWETCTLLDACDALTELLAKAATAGAFPPHKATSYQTESYMPCRNYSGGYTWDNFDPVDGSWLGSC